MGCRNTQSSVIFFPVNSIPLFLDRKWDLVSWSLTQPYQHTAEHSSSAELTHLRKGFGILMVPYISFFFFFMALQMVCDSLCEAVSAAIPRQESRRHFLQQCLQHIVSANAWKCNVRSHHCKLFAISEKLAPASSVSTLDFASKTAFFAVTCSCGRGTMFLFIL